MKVHTSNYEVKGFTNSVSCNALAELAKTHSIPLIDDLGSGTLVDLTEFGLPYERTVQEALNDGADLVTFSGDKLLGGPQCGVIAGRHELISRIEKNPMKRAMRLDKVTLAALEATLKIYATPGALPDRIPALRLLSRDKRSVKSTAEKLQLTLQGLLSDYQIATESCSSQIGSGALPTRTIDSYAVTVAGNSLITLNDQLRKLSVPVVGRISQNKLWLDCRTIDESIDQLCAMLLQELS